MAERLVIKVIVDPEVERRTSDYIRFNIYITHGEEGEHVFSHPELEDRLRGLRVKNDYLEYIGLSVKHKKQVLCFSGYYPFEKAEQELEGLGVGANAERFALKHLAEKYPTWKVSEGILMPPRKRQLRRMGVRRFGFLSFGTLTVEERLARVEKYLLKQSQPQFRKGVWYRLKRFFGLPA